MVVVHFLWFYFVCSYNVAPGENFKAKVWERGICTRHLLLDKFFTGIHRLFVSTPQIAPTGETIIKVKSPFNYEKRIVVVVEIGPIPQPQPQQFK
jgi:hypothetical protein